MTNKIAYLDLLEACKQPGCPICFTTQKAVEHYLNIFFYEQVNDGWVRHDLRRSLGFCHEHAWLATNSEVGDALGLAIIYHDILNTILKGLPDREEVPRSLRKISAWFQQIPRGLAEKLETIQHLLTPQGECPACKQREQHTEIDLSVMIESIQDAEMIGALTSSSGLCLPHLRQAFRMVKHEKDFLSLLSLTRDRLTGTRDELAEFIRKNDYRFMKEGFGPEGDSWKRVVRMMVGNNRTKE